MKTARISHALNAHTGKSILMGLCIALGLLLLSCERQDAIPDFSAEDNESANTDAVEDTYFDDTDDVANEALVHDADPLGGRTELDDRLSCATITREGDTSNGSLRIDFGDGCKDPRGNVRRGVIIIEHQGRWNETGARWSISFVDYSINGIRIEGLRSVSVTSATDSLIVSDVVLTGGRITWPDGRVATREVHRRREHERHGNHLLDRLIIYGTAQGTFRNGRGYSIEILERLIYRRACAAEGVIIPVKGKKLIKHGERELTVDYGDGSCDNIVTLTNKNGKSVRYEVGK